MDHFFLQPSSAYKWVHCSFNPSLEAAVPDEHDTEENRAGTAAHELGEAMIRSYIRAGVDFPKCEGFASNGVLITEEIYESAKVYADYVRGIMQDTGIFTEDLIIIEKKFHIPEIHQLNGGTPDIIIYDRNNGVIYLIDFKHGHRSILAYENWQVLNYAKGVLAYLGLNGHQDQHIRFEFRIIMPRCYDGNGPIREWSVQASELRGYFNQLENAAYAATSGDLVANPGPYCRDCKGRLLCDGLRNAGAALADFAVAAATHELDAEALGFELDWLEKAIKIMEARKDALESETIRRTLKGEAVAGWGTERSQARLAWLNEHSVVIDAGKSLGVDLVKKVEPHTPTEALALVKRIDKANGNENLTKAIKALSHRPNGAVKLKRDTETLAHRVFHKSN